MCHELTILIQGPFWPPPRWSYNRFALYNCCICCWRPTILEDDCIARLVKLQGLSVVDMVKIDYARS